MLPTGVYGMEPMWASPAVQDVHVQDVRLVVAEDLRRAQDLTWEL